MSQLEETLTTSNQPAAEQRVVRSGNVADETESTKDTIKRDQQAARELLFEEGYQTTTVPRDSKNASGKAAGNFLSPLELYTGEPGKTGAKQETVARASDQKAGAAPQGQEPSLTPGEADRRKKAWLDFATPPANKDGNKPLWPEIKQDHLPPPKPQPQPQGETVRQPAGGGENTGGTQGQKSQPAEIKQPAAINPADQATGKSKPAKETQAQAESGKTDTGNDDLLRILAGLGALGAPAGALLLKHYLDQKKAAAEQAGAAAGTPKPVIDKPGTDKAGTVRPADKPAETGKPAPEAPVKVTELPDGRRALDINGQRYHVNPSNQIWFYGKDDPKSERSWIKIHVATTGPQDLGKLQQVLIEELNRPGSEIARLVGGWKTFDPKWGAGEEGFGGQRYAPGKEKSPGVPDAQMSKGFTIYAANPQDAMKLQQLLDKLLVDRGLALEKPLVVADPRAPGGERRLTVDIPLKGSNRVGIVRDTYAATEIPTGSGTGTISAYHIDDEIARKIHERHGIKEGQRMSEPQLRAYERHAGLAAGTLAYDVKGQLALEAADGQPYHGGLYAGESGAGKTFGSLTDRPALYRIAEDNGFNPAELVSRHNLSETNQRAAAPPIDTAASERASAEKLAAEKAAAERAAAERAAAALGTTPDLLQKLAADLGKGFTDKDMLTKLDEMVSRETARGADGDPKLIDALTRLKTRCEGDPASLRQAHEAVTRAHTELSRPLSPGTAGNTAVSNRPLESIGAATGAVRDGVVDSTVTGDRAALPSDVVRAIDEKKAELTAELSRLDEKLKTQRDKALEERRTEVAKQLEDLSRAKTDPVVRGRVTAWLRVNGGTIGKGVGAGALFLFIYSVCAGNASADDRVGHARIKN